MTSQDFVHVHRLLEQIHEALDAEGLYNALSNVLASTGISEEYAIFYIDRESHSAQLAHSSQQVPSETDLSHLASLTTAETLGPTMAALPLSYGEDIYGIVVLMGCTHISDSALMLASSLGTALVKLQIYEESSQASSRARAKIETVNAIAGLLKNLDLEVLLSRLMEISLNVMKAQVGSIVLYRDGVLSSEIEWGLRGEFLLDLKTAEGDPFVENTIQKTQPLLIHDVHAEGCIDMHGHHEALQSLICIPLITKTQVLGALTIVNTQGAFDSNDYEILTTLSLLSAGAIENALLQHNQIEASRLKQQLTIACDIQEKLQAQIIPQVDGLDMDGWCLPCDETGGDYFDFVPRENGELGIIIGDASGHGLPAALMMVGVRSSLLTALQTTDDIATVLDHANVRNEIDSDDDRFMTLFLGFFSKDRTSMRYCSAGHDCPLWFRPSTGAFVSLDANGIPLGLMGEWAYETSHIEGIEKDDIFIFGTDGIWEAFDEHKKPFGIDSLKKILSDNSHLPTSELSAAIKEAVLNHIGTAPHTDDITLIATRITDTFT